MKTQKNNLFAVGLVCGLVLSTFAGHVSAQESSNPLTLSLSETINRDSNLTRTTDAHSDVSSQTDLNLKLDKFYGRQSYAASGRFGIARYKNNKQFDNSNYDLTGRFASEIASNWSVALTGGASQNLNSGANGPVNARFEKNILKNRNADLSVRYGVSGRWSLVASAGLDDISYTSQLQRYQNREQTSQGLRMVYNPSDLIDFSFGVTRAESEYPNLISVETDAVSEKVTQRSLDFGSNWQITGFSVLSGVVSLSKNSYRSDSNADYSAVTSRINWAFTPRGSVAYNLAFSRSTDSDASQTGKRTGAMAETNLGNGFSSALPVNTTFDNITTSLNGSARWTPTAKLGFGLGAAYYHYDVKRSTASTLQGLELINDPSASDASNFTQFSLSGDYRYSRLIGFGCNVQKYKQSKDISRIAYDGHSYGCSASLTLN